MKKFLSAIIVPVLCFFGGACSQETNSQPQKNPQQMVVVISPSLPDRANSLSVFTTWLMHQANCRVQIFDGGDGTQITEFTVPQVKYFKPGAVADRIGAPLQKLIAWKQENAGDPGLIGTGALALPQLLDRIAQNHSAPARLILMGSPVYRSTSNREFDFSEPHLRFPSLGYLNDAKFPLACVGKESSFVGTRVHYLFPKENTSHWPASYEGNLRRFYGALFAKRGGALVSFTPDLEAGLQNASSDPKSSLDEMPATSEFNIVQWHDAHPTIVIPLTITNSLPPKLAKELQSQRSSPGLTLAPDESRGSFLATNSERGALSEPGVRTSVQLVKGDLETKQATTSAVSPQKLSMASGSEQPKTNGVNSSSPRKAPNVSAIPQPKPGMIIVLRYKADAAAGDLYVRPHRQADEISFREPTTYLGAYTYQFDFESGEHVKSIHLPGGCDPSKAELWVNYSKGFGRLAGKIVWLTPEAQTEKQFSFVALTGGDDDYKSESRRRKSDHWQRVNPFDFTIGKEKRASEERPTTSPLWRSSGQPNINGTSVK